MDETLKVGLLQTDIHWMDVDANLAALEEQFHIHIIEEGFDLVVLPELFTTGFGMQAAEHADFMNGKTHRWLRNMASLSNALLLGSVAIRDQGSVKNRLMAVHPEGTTLFYDKKHLFSYGGEHEGFSSGEAQLTIAYKGFKIKPLVCYDLRFPAWSRNTKEMPYDILVYVANWPQTRQYAWDHLLKARAIENQSYVLGCNRVGTDGNGLQYHGGSLALDFEGKVIGFGPPVQGLIVAEVYKADLEAFRSRFPFLNDADSIYFL